MSQALRCVLVGACFAVSYAVLARVFLRAHVQEAVAVLPARLRPLVEGVMRTRTIAP